uniref:Uncharacterized protein n=1 Tax=Ananas comosus var. bracteatus TaxID=296719 RepID=A0A6V7QCR3_ANACO|nr:unnamed protein product [Ananas comosus var. bracteatus]
MESFDLNTSLPPRKRLLAGLKSGNLAHDFPFPIPLSSTDLGARLRDVINSTTASPEEIIEVANSVALAAADVAANARAVAIEKAAIAAKARASAKSALEILDKMARRERKGRQTKAKLKKKHVPVKLFYKTKRSVASRESLENDEEIARRLHSAMNSSPRISKNKQKRNLWSSENEGVSGERNKKPAISCVGLFSRVMDVRWINPKGELLCITKLGFLGRGRTPAIQQEKINSTLL